MQQGRQASPPRPGRPAKPTLRERAELEQRKRAEFGASDLLRSVPVEKKEAPSAFSVFQKRQSNEDWTYPEPSAAAASVRAAYHVLSLLLVIVVKRKLLARHIL